MDHPVLVHPAVEAGVGFIHSGGQASFHGGDGRGAQLDVTPLGDVLPVSMQPHLAKWRAPWIGLQWLFRKGPGTSNHFEAGAFVKSNPNESYPNLMFHFLPIAIRYDGSAPTSGHGYQVHVGPMYSDSKGTVKITSTDPSSPSSGAASNSPVTASYTSNPRPLSRVTHTSDPSGVNATFTGPCTKSGFSWMRVSASSPGGAATSSRSPAC